MPSASFSRFKNITHASDETRTFLPNLRRTLSLQSERVHEGVELISRVMRRVAVPSYLFLHHRRAIHGYTRRRVRLITQSLRSFLNDSFRKRTGP